MDGVRVKGGRRRILHLDRVDDGDLELGIDLSQPFDGAQVQRHLSTAAVRFPCSAGPTADLFYDPVDAERFWLVDDRWGIAELNLLRGRWRAWVLPRPGVDATTVAVVLP